MLTIKPIPKNIKQKIYMLDKIDYPYSTSTRYYSYLTTIKKELVKITVAVKYHKKEWYCKQVAAHGVNLDYCQVKDFEYCYYTGYGFRVGWFAEGLYKRQKWYEDGKWYDAKPQYYNPWSVLVNLEYVGKFPEYRYSGYQDYNGNCIIQYLKWYKQYPQAEYLVKLGLEHLIFSKTINRKIAEDRKFCKWLIVNKEIINSEQAYINSILTAYGRGKSLVVVQNLEKFNKKLAREHDLKELKELFKDTGTERFFFYLEGKEANLRSYLDYKKACDYLGLDMTQDKNRFPHDFKRWHDIRIDQYHSAKAQADEQERPELYKKFKEIALKYLALQKQDNAPYAIYIATSPAELMREGEVLKHCVGTMNYDQKILREESLIFFVRHPDKPDTPFVTVEYSIKAKRVLQCYGQKSLPVGNSVLDFVNKVWLPYVNRKIRKIAA